MLVMLGYIDLFLMDMIQELMITTLPKIVMEDIIWLDIFLKQQETTC